MTLHAPLSPKAAEQKVQELQKIVNDTYKVQVLDGPFMSELRAGKLSKKTLHGFARNWYTFALEVNTATATAYHRFVGFFKRHADAEDVFTVKIGEELTYPGPGGHIRTFLPYVKAIGLTPEDVIFAELIPEARAFVDYNVRSWTEAPLAECYAGHLAEECFGYVAQDFAKSMTTHYGLTKEDVRYFTLHQEADLQGHGNLNRFLLQKSLEDGYGAERPGWPLDYCARITVEMTALFFNGIYRAYR